jgi:G3E family GTPase
VRTLVQTPAIAARFRLNGVVTLVDARNVLGRLRELDDAAAAGRDGPDEPPDEAFQQIMFADHIILNKIDLVSTPRALEVRAGAPSPGEQKPRHARARVLFSGGA